MRIVKILGGLGNQMFQHALAIALTKEYPDEIVKVDISAFNSYPFHNGYELPSIFSNTLPKASIIECAKIGYPLPNYRLWQLGSRVLPQRKSMLRELTIAPFNKQVFDIRKKYFDGYWQTEKYFDKYRDEIIRFYSFPSFDSERNIELFKRIQGRSTVSVHIRRGDYLNNPLYKGICTIEYYKKSIELLKSQIKIDLFIVFSNDISWVKKNLYKNFGNSEVCFVDWNKGKNSYRDMQLMSLCSHNIIANSSFSWWGAWLNKNPRKKIISPDKWINIKTNIDIIPSSWNKITD